MNDLIHLPAPVKGVPSSAEWGLPPSRPSAAAAPRLSSEPTQYRGAAESEFEHDLLRYLGALGWKDTSCVVPDMGNGQEVTVGPSAMRRFDFRGAGAKLVASVPGRWTGGDMNCW